VVPGYNHESPKNRSVFTLIHHESPKHRFKVCGHWLKAHDNQFIAWKCFIFHVLSGIPENPKCRTRSEQQLPTFWLKWEELRNGMSWFRKLGQNWRDNQTTCVSCFFGNITGSAGFPNIEAQGYHFLHSWQALLARTLLYASRTYTISYKAHAQLTLLQYDVETTTLQSTCKTCNTLCARCLLWVST